MIWRETILLKESGKPFVVSMSDLAASGGYYISCAADHIFANATTITGSIGVFGMIPNLGGMLEKHVGITFDEVALHDHAGHPTGCLPRCRGFANQRKRLRHLRCVHRARGSDAT